VSQWIFLRHGESEANRARVFSGHHDVELTALGETQARQAGREIAELLGGARLDLVLSSDLQRAVRTAVLATEAAGQTTTIGRHPSLRERHLGEWQGESIDKLKASGERSILHTWHGRAPGGESLAELAHRSITPLARLGPAENVLLVGHGGLIRVLIGLLDGLDTTLIGPMNIPNGIPILRVVPSGRWADIATELSG
jgi:broad specificity phosphatase PhoE